MTLRLPRKYVFVWNLNSLGDFNVLAGRFRAARITDVMVKPCDGHRDFNAAYLPAFMAAMQAAGVTVWAWHYIYGGSNTYANTEALAFVRNQNRYNFAGLLIDAESEYKQVGSSYWATAYTAALRTHFPTLPLGLCSYRWPSVQPEFPWRAFLNRCDFHAPQVYWLQAHNPSYQLERSVNELRAIRDLPIVPVGAAFTEHGWSASVLEINAFNAKAKSLNLPGVGWWCWDDTNGIGGRDDYYQAIAAHDWGDLPPAPDPEPDPAGLRLRVIQAGLNVRTGPGTTYPAIGTLQTGQVVTPLDVGGAGAWVKIALPDGRTGWANVQLGTDRNMESVE